MATLTYVAEGSVSYEDTNGARGVLESGGLEWMRSGRGVWHGGGPGHSRLTRGFQLWVALPPHLELGSSTSIYRSAEDVPASGPARVLLGEHDGVKGAIATPAGINYLAVRLRAGQRWRYMPPAGHDILWLAVGKGAMMTPELIRRGELAVFAAGQDRIDFVASSETEFVLGSAPPHPHELVTGRYSVHTSEEALAAGERRIREIYIELVRAGRL
ncbi:MAG TPA: pirin family protein [Sphingomicrobium sp.]|nr:pirin family protein [Sphingomicrobium sp.]